MPGINLLESQARLAWARNVNRKVIRYSIWSLGLALVGWGLVFGGEWYWEVSGGDVSQRIEEMESAVDAYSRLEQKIEIFKERLDLLGTVLGDEENEMNRVFAKVIEAVDTVDGGISDVSYQGEEWNLSVKVGSVPELGGLNELIELGLEEIGCGVKIWGPVNRQNTGEYVEDLEIVCNLSKKTKEEG